MIDDLTRRQLIWSTLVGLAAAIASIVLRCCPPTADAYGLDTERGTATFSEGTPFRSGEPLEAVYVDYGGSIRPLDRVDDD
uniref:Uncharacterized protein n=1 Tax=viral metagenome TaxID=1070528 RepID=A0A6M3L542_9ZZZZ